MLFWAYVHQFQNFLLVVHDREFCSVRRQGAGRPTETSANVVRLALLRTPRTSIFIPLTGVAQSTSLQPGRPKLLTLPLISKVILVHDF